jgi:predicted ATP-dependent protease
MESKTKESLEKELKKLKKFYEEELKRKDKIIDELKESNSLILKSALKQSERLTHLTERFKMLVGKKK